VRRATAARTTGATSVPNSSIERMMLVVRNGADAELHEEAVVAEDLVLPEDLLGDLLRRADEVRALQGGRRVELLAGHRRPAALAADAVHHLRERSERGVARACEVSATKPCELIDMCSSGFVVPRFVATTARSGLGPGTPARTGSVRISTS
jgi:hypothetical protein